MAKQGGLRRWFAEEWVDIGAKKKEGKYQPCGRKSAKGSKGSILSACLSLLRAE